MNLKNNLIDIINKINLKSINVRRNFLIFMTVFLMICMVLPNVSASISPDFVEKELERGECYTVIKTVEIPPMSPDADVVFAFDLTVSMGSVLSIAKLKAGEIMNTLINSYPEGSFTFGVMSYMDYTGFYNSCNYLSVYGNSGDYAYSLNQSLTDNTAAVTTAINDLTLGSGGDEWEDYTRVFYESYNDSNIGWRTGAKKLLVNFGDSVPHDCNLNEGIYPETWSTGNDPGRDEIMGTSDDLDLQSVLASMNSSGVTLIECHTTPSYIDYWNYWTGITGGSVYITNSSNLVDDVVNATTSGLTNPIVYNLHLEVITPGYESWFSADPLYYDEVDAGTNVTFEETICVPMDASPGLHTFYVSAVDEDEVSYGIQTNEITVIVNNPPDTPSNPSPADGATNIDLNPTLEVDVFDPDGDKMNVSFYNANGDVYIGTDNNVTSGETASFTWSGLGYSTPYSWYAVANDSLLENTSDTWGFTTKSGGGGGNPPPTYYSPTSDPNGPYYGFIGEEIEFDGTGSHDNDEGGESIEKYDWKFFESDTWHVNLGPNPTFTYNEPGDYTVTLRVYDDEASNNVETTTVHISQPTYPPSIIIVEVETAGHVNISYTYTVSSTDDDLNDTIFYTFNWGDGTNTTSGVLASNSSFNATHSWSTYGVYTVTITAEDSIGSQDFETITVLIDVLPIDDVIEGYLVDEDSDDTYDSFDDTDTGGQTVVKKENNTYLIDINGDGKWDYAFNLVTGLSTYYDYVYYKYYDIYQQSTPGFELIPVLAMMALLLIILRRRR